MAYSVGHRHANLTPPQQAIYEDGVKRFTAAFKKYGRGGGGAPEGRAAYALDRIEDGVEKRLRDADVSFVRDENGNRFGFDVLVEIKSIARYYLFDTAN